MKHLSRISLWLAGIAFFAFSAALFAQSGGMQGNDPGIGQNSGKGHEMTVTGCLKRGSEDGGYYLTGDDGKTYELSGKPDLSQHVNHVVTAMGHISRMSKSEESKMEQNEKGEAAGNAYADLHVDNLKMVSDSCTR